MHRGVGQKNDVSLTQQPLEILKPFVLLLGSDLSWHDGFPKFLESDTRVLRQMINNRARTFGERGIFRNGMRTARPDFEFLFPLEDSNVSTGKLATNDRHKIGRITFFFSHSSLEQGQESGRKEVSTDITNDPGTIHFLKSLVEVILSKVTLNRTGIIKKLSFNLFGSFDFRLGSGLWFCLRFYFYPGRFLCAFFGTCLFRHWSFLFGGSLFNRGSVIGSRDLGSFLLFGFFRWLPAGWFFFCFRFLALWLGNLPLGDSLHAIKPRLNGFLAMLHADLSFVGIK